MKGSGQRTACSKAPGQVAEELEGFQGSWSVDMEEGVVGRQGVKGHSSWLTSLAGLRSLDGVRKAMGSPRTVLSREAT